jgi:hypothetical protein
MSLILNVTQYTLYKILCINSLLYSLKDNPTFFNKKKKKKSVSDTKSCYRWRFGYKKVLQVAVRIQKVVIQVCNMKEEDGRINASLEREASLLARLADTRYREKAMSAIQLTDARYREEAMSAIQLTDARYREKAMSAIQLTDARYREEAMSAIQLTDARYREKAMSAIQLTDARYREEAMSAIQLTDARYCTGEASLLARLADTM